VARIDLHLHSSASDGEYPPRDVVRRTHAALLDVIALTDHDTLAGVGPARAEAALLGIQVIAGCEFSVAAPWGEMHLLAYFLPLEHAELEGFLDGQRARRMARGETIVRRLQALGVALMDADVRVAAGKGAVGRPHVARALLARRLVANVQEAFDRYLGLGRPAYVAKDLPQLAEVVALVRGVGGVTSAAHLKERGDPQSLERLQAAGVDAVEVVHPAHDTRARRRLEEHARRAGLLLTGGSDWHGESRVDEGRGELGTVTVPEAWLEAVTERHATRMAYLEVTR
jgi:predicted metal-dependent phosphoesterase TrpH